MTADNLIGNATYPARVLVVDDNADSAEMMTLALSTVGFETRYALDGVTAFSVAEEFQPAVALLDLALPGIDGYELARRIRQHPVLHDMKLVALTGFGQARDRTTSTSAGFDLHLVKPVDLAELVRVLNGFTSSAPSR